MKVLLGTKNETLGFKPDGKGKGSKIFDIDVKIFYFIENEDNQCMIVKARQLLDFEDGSKANYEFNCNKFIKIKEYYYGKTSHAISRFIEQMLEDIELVSDVAVLNKIQKTLEDLANSDDFAKFLKEYKR